MWSKFATAGSFLKFALGRKFGFLGWDGDGREQKLLKYVLEHSEPGNAQSVIKTIDEFVASGTWLMNIGPEKGEMMDAALKKKDPSLVLELGTYCGYSAVRIASTLRDDAKLVTLELIPHIAEIAKKIIDHAGLSSKVQVLLAPLTTRIEDLRSILAKEKKQSFDFVFIDHAQDCYLPDYLELKKNELIGEGTIIFADNLGIPGAPDYLNYLQTHPDELENEIINTTVGHVPWMRDTVGISMFHKL